MTRPRFALRLLALSWLLAVATGCSTSEAWIEKEFSGVEFENMWAFSQGAMVNAGFQIEEADRSAREISTRWLFHPWMFANDAWRKDRERLRQPFRTKARIRLEEVEEKRWNVAVRVERERNTDLVDPSNEARANWYREDDDEEKARQLLYRIENSVRLFTGQPEEEPKPPVGGPSAGTAAN